MDTKIFSNFSYGMYITSTFNKKVPTGCITNSVMQITSTPAIFTVSINHNNFTNQCLKKTKKAAISILPQNTDPIIIGTFGFRSGSDFTKFDNIPYKMESGLPVLKNSCGYIAGEIINEVETTTHTVFFMKVVNAKKFNNEHPMTYAYYHNVIKGHAPKNAPTYIYDDI